MFSAFQQFPTLKFSRQIVSMETSKYVFTEIAENPKSSFKEMVIKFRNNYRKFGEHLAKIYKNSAEN